MREQIKQYKTIKGKIAEGQVFKNKNDPTTTIIGKLNQNKGTTTNNAHQL